MNISQVPFNTKSLECPICFDLCETPTMPICQHIFCKVCIESWDKMTCPECRKPFTVQELAFSRIHQELIENVKLARQNALPLEPKPLISAATRALFLKFKIVKNQKELDALERMLATGAIASEEDERLLEKLPCKLEKTLTEKTLSIDEEEALFIALLSLIDYDGFADSAYMYLAGSQCRLRADARLSAVDIFKKHLTPENPRLKDLLRCLIYSIEHPEIPFNLKEEAFLLVHQFVQNLEDKVNLLGHFCAQQYLPQAIHGRIVESLMEYFAKIDNKGGILGSLGTCMHRFTDHDERILDFLMSRIQDSSEAHSVRRMSSEAINRYLRKENGDRPFTLDSLRERHFKQLADILLTEQNIPLAYYVTCALFNNVHLLSPKCSLYTSLLNLHSRIIHDDALPIKIRESLFTEITRWNLHGLPKSSEQQIVYIAHFMLKKLHDPGHPLELKISYAGILVHWLKHRDASEPLKTAFPSIQTIDDLVHLEPIMDNPQLLEKALQSNA